MFARVSIESYLYLIFNLNKQKMDELLTPKTLFYLTYGDNIERFNGLDIVQKEVNDVSERWQKFVEENYIPKQRCIEDNDENIRM